MPNPPGNYNLDTLYTEFAGTLRDNTVTSTVAYRHMRNEYSRIWYMHPWEFRRAVATFSVSAGVSEYALGSDVDLPLAFYNETSGSWVSINRDYISLLQEWGAVATGGIVREVADMRSVNGDNLVVFRQTPASGQGHGDVIRYYYLKHLIHNDSAGATVTGNLSVSTDVPSFAPQFHLMIAYGSLLKALRDRREFGEPYQACQKDFNEIYASMKKRYLTPTRGDNTITIYRR